MTVCRFPVFRWRGRSYPRSMRQINQSVRRIAQLILVASAVAFPCVAANPQTPAPAPAGGPGVPGHALQRLAAEARTADLRGNWDGLVRAHQALAAMAAAPGGRAWTRYYLDYLDWPPSRR